MNIIQIGCNNGNDHVYKFINDNAHSIKKAQLADVSEKAIGMAKELYKNHPNVEIINIAICPENQNEIEIFHVGDLADQGLSYRKNHFSDHGNNTKTNSFIAKCKTINKFLEDSKMDIIDRLYIDIEGLDCVIVNEIDLAKHDIRMIQFEHVHSENTGDYGNSELYKKVVGKLITNGFTISTLETDTVAVRL